MSLWFQYPLKNPAAAGGPTVGNNWSWELGNVDWTPVAPATLASNFGAEASFTGLSAYHGGYICHFVTFINRVTAGLMPNADTFTAAPGESWTATCQVISQAPNFSAYGRIAMQWLDAGSTVLSTVYGNSVPGNGGIASPPWVLSTLTATAPASTAKVRIAVDASNDNALYRGAIYFDWCTLKKNG